MKSYRNIRFLITLINVSAIFGGGIGFSPQQVRASIFYENQVIAQTQVFTPTVGGAAFSDLGAGPSVNDNGYVAFVGTKLGSDSRKRDNLYSGLYGSANLQNLMNDVFVLPNSGGAPTQVFDPNVQVNNRNEVAARRNLNAIVLILFQQQTAPFTYIEEWPVTGNINVPGSRGLPDRLVVMGDANSLPFNVVSPDYFAVYPSRFTRTPGFSIVGNPSLNNMGQLAFRRFELVTATPEFVSTDLPVPPSFASQSVPTRTRPMIADNGAVVYRSGTTPAGASIILDDYSLTSPQFVAGAANGFSSVGVPGISDDGNGIAFFGSGNAGMPPGFQGAGIWLSFDQGAAGRTYYPIVGFSGELGMAGGTPVSFDSSSFDSESRVSVIHQELGQPGLADDCFVVSFLAKPTAASPDALFTAEKGVWIVKVRMTEVANPLPGDPPFSPQSAGIMPVAQVGDTDILSGDRLTDVAINDSLALVATNPSGTSSRIPYFGEHRIVFHATAGIRQAIVLGTYLDTDEDALPDHWERIGGGVTIGGQFIDLPTMGANPLRKDLFVHADWKNVGGGGLSQYKPSNIALKPVVDAFFSGDTPNPDNTTGITLHVDSGPDSWMKPGTRWGVLAKAGPVPVGSPVVIWSGLRAAQQNGLFNSSKRGAVFRYCLFADSYDLYPNSSGLAQTPGGLFVITLGTTGGTRARTTGTFMHEFGHTLGLLHGGTDDVNLKPNYLSVMNYFFQFPGLYTNAQPRGLKWDYCRRPLPELDEATLFETAGIGDPSFRTLWFYPDPVTGLTRKHAPDVSMPADWNGDGAITAGQLPSPGVNLNNDYQLDLLGNPILTMPIFSKLTGGLNEWRNLVLDGGGHIGAALGASQTPTELGPIASVIEATVAELDSLVPQDIRNAQEQAPVDDVTYSPALGYAPLIVSFDGSASTAPLGAVVAWAWSFDDGGVGAGATTTHSYVTPGIYKARLTVTDNLGNTNLSPGLQVMEVRTLGDIDGDTDVDRDDLAILLKARNTPASGMNDLRDLNRDGKIDALDSRILATKFTRPRGATQ